MTIEARVKQIVAKELGKLLDEVNTASNLGDDLGADSLDSVNLIIKLEEEFNISISDEDALKINTVGDAVHFVTKALAAD